MIVIPASDQQTIETPNGNYGVGLATPSRGATDVSVIRQRQRPGGFNPLHSQNCEEVMVQLAGSVALSSNDIRVILNPGDVAIIPAHTPHRLDTVGEVDAEWLIISTATVRFFRESGEEARPPWAQ